ncbi:DUF5318 domain-containing protein [Corynebacterium sp. ES2794-CONJ1]|uniref:DUF5318 domain-containing protein n=1 Tax=unclassified Corynebacterium TaxID=2624378 RepID=UPI0021670B91|nr:MULTISPECIES: DUF5318 domain-containing protein [unclassified Corynebacterium]MCS4490492.1 DUF5318 domain-containing protein [Corynebacterium sp. ES2775-CONJ]MCS4492272.1 DUF5318 domain-containing protein [Corynebacterium sp. ES2715-CONJ3]MCS4532244.1 DUF5318 domain-containing protein [Corynebacterium sp. ES2730-CONJ]MCU9519791.1 DUF5318 domain-containing protein [Corynebacterium sp. ES2794-CONJ1]
MVEFVGQVTHRLARRRLLNKWRAGQVSRAMVCEADFLLVAAARYHGTPAPYPCPICSEDDLREVLWVYGEQLGRASGSARSLAEIEQFTQQGREFTIHKVEVCPNCQWNHLLAAAHIGP